MAARRESGHGHKGSTMTKRRASDHPPQAERDAAVGAVIVQLRVLADGLNKLAGEIARSVPLAPPDNRET